MASKAKKSRSESTDANAKMQPSFMGDSGFDAQHLLHWNVAEQRVGIMNVVASASRKQAPPSHRTHPYVNARVPPSYTKECKLYQGHVPSYVFKKSEDGV